MVAQTIGDWLNAILDALPIPKNIFEFIWAAMGWQAGKAFGQSLDEDIMEKVKQNKWLRPWAPLILRLLNFIHHWWIGGLMTIYFGYVTYYTGMPLWPCPEAFWFGVGLTVQDLLDDLKKVSIRVLSR